MGQNTGLGAAVLSVQYSAAPLWSGAGKRCPCRRGCVGGALSLLPGGPQECFSKGPPVLQTMLTAISMSAIATNGVVPGKGCWQSGHLKCDFLQWVQLS